MLDEPACPPQPDPDLDRKNEAEPGASGYGLYVVLGVVIVAVGLASGYSSVTRLVVAFLGAAFWAAANEFAGWVTGEGRGKPTGPAPAAPPPTTDPPPASSGKPRRLVAGLVVLAIGIIAFGVVRGAIAMRPTPPAVDDQRPATVAATPQPGTGAPPGVGPTPGPEALSPDNPFAALIRMTPAELNGLRLTPLPVLAPDVLFARFSPAVVQVKTFDRKNVLLASGTAFLVSPDGLFATNFHVIRDAHRAFLFSTEDTAWEVAGVVAADEDADLAVVRAEYRREADDPPLAERWRLPVLELAADLPPVGSKVYAIGNPLGLSRTLSDGLVSGHRGKGTDAVIQTTAPISPGSSGGPLFAADGRVVGVTTGFLKGGQNLNIAVPASQVARLLRSRWEKPAALPPTRRPSEPPSPADAPARVLLRARQAGDRVRVTESRETIKTLYFDDFGRKREEVWKEWQEFAYTEEVLAVPAAGGLPTKARRVYTTAVERRAGKQGVYAVHEYEFANKVVLIEKQEGTYGYRLEGGGPITGSEARWFRHAYEPRASIPLRRLIPDRLIEPGKAWVLDREVIDDTARSSRLTIDAERSIGSGLLLNAYRRDGRRFGAFAFHHKLIPTEHAGKTLRPGSTEVVDISWDACIDGTTNEYTQTIRVRRDHRLPIELDRPGAVPDREVVGMTTKRTKKLLD